MQQPDLSRRGLLAGLAASLAAPTLARAASVAAPSVAAPSVAAPSVAAPSVAAWGGLELIDAQRRVFKVAALDSRLTLVRLWANWCPVCLRELSCVQDTAERLGAHGASVILVSHPTDWERNQRLARDHGITVRSARLSDGNPPGVLRDALLTQDGTFYVPRSLLFSRGEQRVVWSHTGAVDWTAAEWPIDRWLG